MGCDMHVVIERRRGETWEAVDGAIPAYPLSPNFATPGELEAAREAFWNHPGVILENRNYALFGVLAGVRSRINTPAIAPYRGLPEGHTLGEEELEPGYYHSHTWVSLQELLDHDWDQPVEDPSDDEAKQVPLREAVGTAFCDRVLPWLQTFTEDPRDLRLVLFFDS